VRNLLRGHSEEMRSGAVRKLKSARKMKQWRRLKDRELVNSKNQGRPLIKIPVKGTWAETWRTKRKRKPTNGQKIMKLLRCPHAMVSIQSNRTESNSVNDVTRVKLPKIQKPGCDSKIMVACKKPSNSLGGYSNHRC
jgi:hypothetical protein